VPSNWVTESTHPWSDSGGYIPGTFYGYMWWVMPTGYGAERGLDHLSQFVSYAALGAYGQVIQVIPGVEVVFVHRVNSDIGNSVNFDDIDRLVDMILAARP